MNITPQKHQSRGPSHATGKDKATLADQNQPTPAKNEDKNAPLDRSETPRGSSSGETHAKNDGDASVFPKELQEKLPESVERAVPNVLHDTGDTSGKL